MKPPLPSPCFLHLVAFFRAAMLGGWGIQSFPDLGYNPTDDQISEQQIWATGMAACLKLTVDVFFWVMIKIHLIWDERISKRSPWHPIRSNTLLLMFIFASIYYATLRSEGVRSKFLQTIFTKGRSATQQWRNSVSYPGMLKSFKKKTLIIYEKSRWWRQMHLLS